VIDARHKGLRRALADLESREGRDPAHIHDGGGKTRVLTSDLDQWDDASRTPSRTASRPPTSRSGTNANVLATLMVRLQPFMSHREMYFGSDPEESGAQEEH